MTATRATSIEKGPKGSNPVQEVHPHLNVGAMNDPLEREADNVANQVMRMPESVLIQRKCSSCEEEEQRVQRKPLANFIQKKGTGDGGVASGPVTQKINASRGKGRPLPEGTKSFMESRFGTDFAGVNIHTGREAAQLSNELNAKAFTVGKDIYFNRGQFTPGSKEGKHLLAHELAHTIQQSPNIQRQAQPQEPEPGFHPEVNVDPSSVEIILTQAVEALGNFRLQGQLTQPLNVVEDLTGTSLGVPNSTINLSLAYNDRCNRALQNFFVGINQQQADGQSVFDFSQAQWSSSVGGGVRLGGLRVDARGTATFQGNQFQALTFALTFTRGVNQAIPEECRNTPATTPGSGTPTGDVSLCGNIDCDAPMTVENSFLHQICCIRTPLASRTVYFYYDTPIFKPESNDVLNQIRMAMHIFPTMHAQVIGHTSLEGTEAHNQRLSERRAQAVRTYLQIHSIDSSRVQILSMGEYAPAVTEPAEPDPDALRLPGNEAIRDLNRRAEVTYFDPSGTIDTLPTLPPMELSTPEFRLTLPSGFGDDLSLTP